MLPAACASGKDGLRRTITEGTWRQLVEEQMGFRPTVRDKVRAFWLGYIKAAEAQGLPALPFDFVVSFVDQNFPHLVGGADVH